MGMSRRQKHALACDQTKHHELFEGMSQVGDGDEHVVLGPGPNKHHQLFEGLSMSRRGKYLMSKKAAQHGVSLSSHETNIRQKIGIPDWDDDVIQNIKKRATTAGIRATSLGFKGPKGQQYSMWELKGPKDAIDNLIDWANASRMSHIVMGAGQDFMRGIGRLNNQYGPGAVSRPIRNLVNKVTGEPTSKLNREGDEVPDDESHAAYHEKREKHHQAAAASARETGDEGLARVHDNLAKAHGSARQYHRDRAGKFASFAFSHNRRRGRKVIACSALGSFETNENHEADFHSKKAAEHRKKAKAARQGGWFSGPNEEQAKAHEARAEEHEAKERDPHYHEQEALHHQKEEQKYRGQAASRGGFADTLFLDPQYVRTQQDRLRAKAENHKSLSEYHAGKAQEHRPKGPGGGQFMSFSHCCSGLSRRERYLAKQNGAMSDDDMEFGMIADKTRRVSGKLLRGGRRAVARTLRGAARVVEGRRRRRKPEAPPTA